MNITFASGDVRPVHTAMVDAARGKNVWVVRGGELVGQFADSGLLDETIIGVAPVTLGAGASLLRRRLLSLLLSLTTWTGGRLRVPDLHVHPFRCSLTPLRRLLGR
jgi:dihydrofolate reductase